MKEFPFFVMVCFRITIKSDDLVAHFCTSHLFNQLFWFTDETCIGTTHLYTSQGQSGCASELLHRDSMVLIIHSDSHRNDITTDHELDECGD